MLLTPEKENSSTEISRSLQPGKEQTKSFVETTVPSFQLKKHGLLGSMP